MAPLVRSCFRNKFGLEGAGALALAPAAAAGMLPMLLADGLGLGEARLLGVLSSLNAGCACLEACALPVGLLPSLGMLALGDGLLCCAVSGAGAVRMT